MYSKEHIVEALRKGAEEIESLRRRNEVLQATVNTVEIFGRALQRNPGYGELGVDAAWNLRSMASGIEAEEKNPGQATLKT